MMNIDARTAAVLKEFDWDRHSDLQYLDEFFAKWGFEPFAIPTTLMKRPVAARHVPISIDEPISVHQTTPGGHVPLPESKKVMQWVSNPRFWDPKA